MPIKSKNRPKTIAPKVSSPCSPGVWKKLNKQQQSLWLALYETFLFEGCYHVSWTQPDQREEREVTAHNMACQTVWALHDLAIL